MVNAQGGGYVIIYVGSRKVTIIVGLVNLMKCR